MDRMNGHALAVALALLALPGCAEARAQRPKVAAVDAKSAKQVKAVSQPPSETARPIRRSGPLYAVVIGPGPAWKKGQPLRKAGDPHWRYWQGLSEQGLVESAGPVGKDTGFILLHAKNQREADALIAADPAVKAGRFRAVARPYDRTLGD